MARAVLAAAVLAAVAFAAVGAVETVAGCHDQASCTDYVMHLEERLPGAAKLAEWMDVPALKHGLVGMLETRGPLGEPWSPHGERDFGDIHAKWCPDNGPYQFLPVHVASLFANAPAQGWANSCFQNNQARFVLDSSTNKGTIQFKPDQPSGALCDDMYIVITAFKAYWIDVGTLSKNHTIEITQWEDGELQDVTNNGFRVLTLPCGLLGSVISAVNTVGLYVGNQTHLRDVNMDFLVQRGVFDTKPPVYESVQYLDPKYIRSGDYLAIMRLDGLDPMIMWGTGGRTGHSAMFIWLEDELYVTESTAANPFGYVYWPPPYGVVIHKYDEWIQLAIKAGYHIDVLPLTDEMADKFDADAWWAWFNSTAHGQPYGFHNMLFSFMDTFPMQNLPEPIDDASFIWVLHGMSVLLPNSTGTGGGGVSVFSLFVEGFNHRLGEFCPDVDCVSRALLDSNRTLGELGAIPEQDVWRYDGHNMSMVCSVYVAESWKTGFGDNWPFIEGTEQTPKDNYQMQIFSPDRFNETVCPTGLIKSDTGNYCQLMGHFRLPLNGYNSVPLYANMNDHCPAQWPGYFRCPADNPKCC